jgi:hypothetical protein
LDNLAAGLTAMVECAGHLAVPAAGVRIISGKGGSRLESGVSIAMTSWLTHWYPEPALRSPNRPHDVRLAVDLLSDEIF